MLMCALFYPLHMRPRVQRASGIPCALLFEEGVRIPANLGRNAPRECERMFSVIARSEATKQSILSLRREMDCFAALAMTSPGPLPRPTKNGGANLRRSHPIMQETNLHHRQVEHARQFHQRQRGGADQGCDHRRQRL